MTIPDTGILDANQVAEPVASEARPIPHASPSQVAEAKRAAFEKASATVGKPAPGASAEPAATEGSPAFFTKKTEEAPAFDPAKLPPELQPIYKSMQADATRKWEEAARMRRETEDRQAKFDEERRIMMESQKGLLEAIERGRAPGPSNVPTMKEQIQQLRDEGRFAEADELVLKYVDQIAEEKAAPLRQEAQKHLMESTFTSTLGKVRAQNPVAAHYWDQVSQVFDSNSPEMVGLRRAVLSSPETIQQYVPLVIDYIATRQHAAQLEQNYEAAVKAGIEKGIADRRAAALRTPGSLVESGSTSRESAPGRMDLKQAFALAKESA